MNQNTAQMPFDFVQNPISCGVTPFSCVLSGLNRATSFHTLCDKTPPKLGPMRKIMYQNKGTEVDTWKIMDVVLMVCLVSVALWLLYVLKATFG